jgi:ubiquinone/menaquinone biosynthesis C-methylase UbiE
MPNDRDVAAFEARAAHYEHGPLGRLHRDLADKTLGVALTLDVTPQRILDVGCGTGYLLRSAAACLPDATELVGVDPAAAMIEAAGAAVHDERLAFRGGRAEDLAFADGYFDLVLATTSFDHWADQHAGLSEAARVLAAGGYLVLADLVSLWLLPTMVTVRRGHARTPRRLRSLLEKVGLEPVGRQHLDPLIQAISARRPAS